MRFSLFILIILFSVVANAQHFRKCPVDFSAPFYFDANKQTRMDTLLDQFDFGVLLSFRSNWINRAPQTSTAIGYNKNGWQKIIITNTYEEDFKTIRVAEEIKPVNQQIADSLFTALCSANAFNLNPVELSRAVRADLKDGRKVVHFVADAGQDHIVISKRSKRKLFYVDGIDYKMEFISKYQVSNKGIQHFAAIKKFVQTL